MENELAIKVDNISKTFKLPHEKHTSIKGLLFSKIKGRKTISFEKQKVLDNISFDVEKGDFLGIVGRNGSGKSTLLKLLAGVYYPDKGNIQINGKLTPFIELGVGFNPELTGRENVFLNGSLLGFSRNEIEKMYPEIVEFAELEKFMDQKLKNYSSGMQVRLAFSIAIRAQSDILVLDEVLAVGDANFQKKCYNIFKQYKTQNKTVVLVTHDMGAVEQFCNKAIMLEEGKIIINSTPKKVTDHYNLANIEQRDKRIETSKKISSISDIYIKDFWIQDKTGKKTKSLSSSDSINVNIKVHSKLEVNTLVAGVIILDQTGRSLFATNTLVKKAQIKVSKNSDKLINIIIDNVLSDGNYYIVPTISDSKTEEIYDSIDEGYLFSIYGWDYPAYVLQPNHKIEVK